MNKKAIIFFLSAVFLFFGLAQNVSAHQPRIVYFLGGNVKIKNPEISQAFYDKLKGESRSYFINSGKDFDLYVNILVPAFSNPKGRYSVNILYLQDGKEEQVAFLDGSSFKWEEFYEPFGRDYYLKGPEFEKNVKAGNYKITVFSEKNWGEYVLAVGKKETFGLFSIINIYWQLPLLKIDFFKTSVLQFFLTPFGIALLIVFFVLIIIFLSEYSFISLIKQKIESSRIKTILLSSNGMEFLKDEVKKFLHKPAYDILVGFITTASKNEEDTSYMERDLEAMKEIGFNVEKIDIEGKNERELRSLLGGKDIIFVEGGNTFYLLKHIRESSFEKVVKELIKKGVVYFGVSAGSIVAGQTVETALLVDENIVRFKNFKGLGLVPFNIFAHYNSEYQDLLKQELKKSKYPLRALTDEQAILIQGKETMFLGKGEEIIFKKEKSKFKNTLEVMVTILIILLIFLFFLTISNPNLFAPKPPI